jgi:hypothetical protein
VKKSAMLLCYVLCALSRDMFDNKLFLLAWIRSRSQKKRMSMLLERVLFIVSLANPIVTVLSISSNVGCKAMINIE